MPSNALLNVLNLVFVLGLCISCDPSPSVPSAPESGPEINPDGGGDAEPTPSIPDTGPSDADAGPPVCGDGAMTGSEACDDGNTADGDGCSADCATVETNYVCVVAGMPCVRIVTCGNGRIEGDETCDDRNTTPGDGCDADCRRETGWVCPAIGAACSAAECGDGIVAGFEICDDGNTTSGDGCSDGCQLEEGYKCPTPGAPCTRTTCGDSITEGTEECDDGNLQIGDGCTPFCVREPDCTDGVCTAVCGDEVVFAPETCDDGNVLNGDGCSSTCELETGYACTETPLAAPSSITHPVVLRDFIPSSACTSGVSTRAPDSASGAVPPYGHPDFQCPGGGGQGMVLPMLVDGRPVRSTSASSIESDASFARWYTSDSDYNRTVVQAMPFDLISSGYRFDSSSFFPLSTPLDGSAAAGFPSEGLENLQSDGNGSGLQNFFFTSEVRVWFRYAGTEVLAFSGDDDVWVFINDQLAVDIGGIHGRLDGSITLSDCADADPAMNASSCPSALDLSVGGIYEAVVFQAERHTVQSQYRLTLSNFTRAPSTCTSSCGDGILASNEACDNGDMNGADYNGCRNDCTPAPYCGDGIVQAEFGEICDDGLNLGGSASACAPRCMEMGARCGDGVVQLDNDEQCDDGNTMSGDGCSETCQIELI